MKAPSEIWYGRNVETDDARHAIATARDGNGIILQEYTRDGHRANLGQAMRCSTVIPLSDTTGAPQHFDGLVANNRHATTTSEMSLAQRREEQQLYTPNLSIPDDDDTYLTREQ